MAEQHLINNLVDHQKKLSELNFERFYREIEGQTSFVKLKPSIDELIKKVASAVDVAQNVSSKTLQDFNNKTSAITSQIKRAIDSEISNFIQQKENIGNQISKDYDELLGLWPEFAVLLFEKQVGAGGFINLEQFKEEIEELTKKSKEEQSKSQEANKTISDIKNKLEQDVKNLNERINPILASGEFLVQQDIFKKQADTHKKLADNWLKGVIGALILLLIVIIYIINCFCFETKCLGISDLTAYNSICSDCGHQVLIFELIKSILFRLFIISLCFFLLMLCVKNYNAQMHNYTINSHKENAFAAALSLLSKAKTDEGNDKLMLEAAQSIFSHQKTGYAGKESETQQLNMLASLVDKIKPSK